MNPRIPPLLARLLELSEKTLDRPSGEPRRREAIDRLHDELQAAAAWGTETPPRLVNDLTLMQIKLLRIVEREAPLGGDGELCARAATLASLLHQFVQADARRALDLLARVSTSEAIER